MDLYLPAAAPAAIPLTYQGFSILLLLVSASAMVLVFRKWQVGRFPQGLRMLYGLAALVVSRLAVYLIAMLSWRTEPTFTPSLLVLDQAAALVGILIIFWLWNFPEPSRIVDPVTLGLGVLFTALAILKTR